METSAWLQSCGISFSRQDSPISYTSPTAQTIATFSSKASASSHRPYSFSRITPSQEHEGRKAYQRVRAVVPSRDARSFGGENRWKEAG